MPGAARRGWSIFLFILIVLLVIFGLILANIPDTKTALGVSVNLCPSLIAGRSGQTNVLQGIANSVSSDCDNYWSGIIVWLFLFAILIVLFLVIAIPLSVSGSHARRKAFRLFERAPSAPRSALQPRRHRLRASLSPAGTPIRTIPATIVIGMGSPGPTTIGRSVRTGSSPTLTAPDDERSLRLTT
jgi:preprotein translocase subunit SecG